MKTVNAYKIRVVLAVCILIVFAGISWAEGPVYFADQNLKAAVEDELGITDPNETDMLDLTSLDASNRGIVDLTGLEYATNLTWLQLYNNQISDVSPISALKKLEVLSLVGNQISDCCDLANLLTLTRLGLSDNQISDISCLSGLTELTGLFLYSNDIVDISPLAGLAKLIDLFIDWNRISDISPLNGLTELSGLHLADNEISDISPLANLEKLEYLVLWGNHISDINAVSGLTNLQDLALGDNQISNISVLSGLTNLRGLGLYRNQITDICALSGLTNLEGLGLSGNQICDINCLSELTNLTDLELGNNCISDISVLSGLMNLRHLFLYGNQISDIGPLSGLMNLERLGLWRNQISDIAPLAEMTKLTLLDLTVNPLNRDAYCVYLPIIIANNPNLTDLRYDPNPEPCQATWTIIGTVAEWPVYCSPWPWEPTWLTLPGAYVYLFPQIDSGDWRPSAPSDNTMTDSNGEYSFPNLEEATYEVGVSVYGLGADLELMRVSHDGGSIETVRQNFYLVPCDYRKDWLATIGEGRNPALVRYEFEPSIDAAFEDAIRAALDTWESVENLTSGVAYVQFEENVKPDIVFTMGIIDDTTPAQADTFPKKLGFPVTITFNSGLSSIYTWSIGAVPSLELSGCQTPEGMEHYAYQSGLDNPLYYLDVETVALHEIGHALGLNHVGDCSNSTMKPNLLAEEWDHTLSLGDVQGLMDLYGPPESASLAIIAHCPVDLEVVDPEGRITTKSDANIPASRYFEDDPEQSEEPADTVMVYEPCDGQYNIQVIPEANAEPMATYSLYVVGGYGPVTLAENAIVGSIPGEGFDIRFDAGQIGYDYCVFESPIINTDFALKDGTTVPIKFHIMDCEGTVITEQRNVSLEVTGPNAIGEDVTYIFSRADGSLRFDAEVWPPHYIANFSTREYSVLDGGDYVATVKENGAPIGSTGFMVNSAAGTGRSNRQP